MHVSVRGQQVDPIAITNACEKLTLLASVLAPRAPSGSITSGRRSKPAVPRARGAAAHADAAANDTALALSSGAASADTHAPATATIRRSSTAPVEGLNILCEWRVDGGGGGAPETPEASGLHCV